MKKTAIIFSTPYFFIQYIKVAWLSFPPDNGTINFIILIFKQRSFRIKTILRIKGDIV